MPWQDPLSLEALAWLLEVDAPGVRYLALRDLSDKGDEKELLRVQRLAHHCGPIAKILDAMHPDGYWAEPGPGYSPKYFSSVWNLILLAQLGASIEMDERIGRACDYLAEHALTPHGQFTASGAPSGTADCLQGNLCWALTELGWDDSRLEAAYDWMARTVTGDGLAPASERRAELRYYAGKCGPGFACGANNRLPCAWGGVKVMLAFSRLPRTDWTARIEAAVAQGVDFLFGSEPAQAEYPHGYSERPSGNWWKFGFPVFYISDLLQNVEALVRLGYGDDPRLANALDVIRDKQNAQGSWDLEYSYAGKTWVDFGAKKQPNKWVTLRALRVLKAVA